MTREEQILKCQTPNYRQSYAQAWTEYERLTGRGIKQVYDLPESYMFVVATPRQRAEAMAQ
jgi:hypothetical protein